MSAHRRSIGTPPRAQLAESGDPPPGALDDRVLEPAVAASVGAATLPTTPLMVALTGAKRASGA
jgi:hypothetical protein